MGIYDRDYYRNESSSFLGGLASSGQVCRWLVAINAAVYIVQLLTLDRLGRGFGDFTDLLVMEPGKAFYEFQLWRPLTGAFLHSPGDFSHIIWNMLALWFFGPDVEELYGKREFLFFYLVAGIVGNVFWGLTTIWQAIPGQHGYAMALGASGAVMAVTLLCAIHYPYRTVLLMFVIPVPFWLCAIILVGADLVHFVRSTNATVAVAAHLGGAGFAFVYYKTNMRLSSFWATMKAFRRRTTGPRLRVFRETPVVAGSVDEQLEAKADAILAKLHQRGLNSLTAEEKEILRQAGEQYKRRRT